MPFGYQLWHAYLDFVRIAKRAVAADRNDTQDCDLNFGISKTKNNLYQHWNADIENREVNKSLLYIKQYPTYTGAMQHQL